MMKQETAKVLADSSGILTVSTGIGASVLGWLGHNAAAIGALCAILSLIVHITMTIITSLNKRKYNDNKDQIKKLNDSHEKLYEAINTLQKKSE